MFTLKDSAGHFYARFNGQPFNTIEAVKLEMVFVLRVEVMKTAQGAALPSPDLIELPSCPVCLERLVG